MTAEYPKEVSLPAEYRFENFLAKGGYGAVFRASKRCEPAPALETDGAAATPGQAPAAADVAIKVNRKYAKYASNPEHALIYLKRFAREVALLDFFCRRGFHEFVDVHSFYTSPDGEDLYIVMDLVPDTLASQIAREEMHKLPLETARYILAQILSGLEKLHGAKCSHRDLKPANILVGDNAFVRITDFGLGREAADGPTTITTWVVTPSYRPVELTLGCEHYDPSKVDIWSTGVILYEMVIGKTPFDGKDERALLTNILTAIITRESEGDFFTYWESRCKEEWRPKLSAQKQHIQNLMARATVFENPEVTAALGEDGLRVLRKMLAMKPEERPSATELLDDPWFQNDPECAEIIEVNRAAAAAALANPETSQSKFQDLTMPDENQDSLDYYKDFILQRVDAVGQEPVPASN